MDEHIDRKLKPIHDKLDTLLDTIKSAVPEGDLEGHRKAHEQWLEERDERRAMWAGVRRGIVEWAAKSIIVAAVAAAWFWVKEHVK